MIKKYNSRYYSVTIVVIFFFLISGCKKEQSKLPVLITHPISQIAQTTAISGGTIVSNNGLAITKFGVCLSEKPTPTVKDTVAWFNKDSTLVKKMLTCFLPNTTYYLRAFAENSAGVGYGKIVSFKTTDVFVTFNSSLNYGTANDIDGNLYKTIQIGNQTWMAENLKVIHYRNGDPIINETDENNWFHLTTGAYCLYNNSKNLNEKYGKLYNWYAVNDSRKIAPVGWHVPTKDDWNTFFAHFNGWPNVGPSLLETGSINWNGDFAYTLATNSSGFTALPAGIHDYSYSGIFKKTYWWSSTEYYIPDCGYSFELDFYGYNSFSNSPKEWGLSIRCIKDN